MMLPLLFATACVLRRTAATTDPADCPDCISRSWTCPQRCKGSDTKRHSFDFQYHQTHCREMIPWNGSIMQVDLNLWCAMPQTKGCRNFFCRHRVVGCDNMRKYRPLSDISSLNLCSTPAAHVDFAAQQCRWVCKYGAPYVRCTYSFDRLGNYGLRPRMDKCWIQDTCLHGQRREVTTTCQPEPHSAAAPRANVIGFATLLVPSPDDFLAQTGVDGAVRKALAHLVPTTESQVAVSLQNTGPRRRSLDNTSQPIHVPFNISVFGNSSAGPAQRAIATKVHLEEADSRQLREVLNTALAKRGLEASVRAADLTVSPGLDNLTVQGPAKQEFYALVTLLRKYQEYLTEVRSDLNETQAEMNIQNLSREEFAIVQAKHTAAQERLSEIMASHAELSDEINTAIARRNLTKHALTIAQSAAQSAAAELVRTQANLSSTQADLAAVKTRQIEAEQALLRALAAKQSLNEQLKENTTLLGRSLEAVYEDLKYVRKLLVDAQQANRSAQEELLDLEEDLQEEITSHNATKHMLTVEQQEHLRTKEELRNQQVLRLQEKAKLRQVSKAATQSTLVFILVTICMSAALLALVAFLLVTGLRKRSVERVPVLGTANNGNGQNSVVVGRPVQPAATDAWAPKSVKGEPGPSLLTSRSLAGCLGSPMTKPKSIPDEPGR